MTLRIAILGTRGIPNRYGGFEQVAGYLSEGLTRRGHEVTVYSPHSHPYQDAQWKGVRITHCYDPEKILGTAGQFIYDLNCIRHARKQKFDVWLIMGYTSSSVWWWLYPSFGTTIVNMDGLEWKRSKYSPWVRRFLEYAEKLAAEHTRFHIADAPSIQRYLFDKYGIQSRYIPYGAERVEASIHVFPWKGVMAKGYCLLMARMEPENNIEMVLEGFRNSSCEKEMIILGNTGNRFGSYLVKKYGNDTRVRFAGTIYDKEMVQFLQENAFLYFHGHSVGGTNPSLLEAMASGSLVAAHDNPFNRDVLGANALYFSHSDEVRQILQQEHGTAQEREMIAHNQQRIREEYNWEKIIDSYNTFIMESHKQEKE